MDIFIIRGRFQPFASYHYYAARALILHPDYRRGFENRTSVVLYAIVRNQEIIEQFRNPSGKRASKTAYDTESNRTRYLPLFNPLSTAELILQIQNDVARRVDAELAPNPDTLLLKKVFRHQTIVAPMSVTAKQLCAVLLGGKPKSDEDKVRLALATTSIDLLDDNIDLPDTHWPQHWVVPILDREDIADATFLANNASQLKKKGYELSVIPAVFYPAPYSERAGGDFVKNGRLGFFGGVAAFLHDKYQTLTLKSRQFNQNRESSLEALVGADTWPSFRRAADLYLNNLVLNIPLVSEIERELNLIKSEADGGHLEYPVYPVKTFSDAGLTKILAVPTDIPRLVAYHDALFPLRTQETSEQTIQAAITGTPNPDAVAKLKRLLAAINSDFSAIYSKLTIQEWRQLQNHFPANAGSSGYAQKVMDSNVTALIDKLI